MYYILYYNKVSKRKENIENIIRKRKYMCCIY